VAQWTANDNPDGSPIWAPANFNKAPTRAVANTLFANVTIGAFVANAVASEFGAAGQDMANGALNSGLTHAGWQKVVIGTGGRAGRVQTETLVAGGMANPQGAVFIDIQPSSANVGNGNSAVFTVHAKAFPPGRAISYQWKYAISGSSVVANSTYLTPQTATLTVANSAIPVSNAYFCTVTVAGNGTPNSVNSSNATLATF
jgi:hypothetical protein